MTKPTIVKIQEENHRSPDVKAHAQDWCEHVTTVCICTWDNS